MNITLIHPSRGRAEKAHATYNKWISMASGTIEIEHVLSIDNDDPQKQEYVNKFLISRIACGDHDCVVKATNLAAKYASGDILIYLSDDFICPRNWDTSIAFRLKDHGMYPILLKVDDCLQNFNMDMLTMPIMNRALYKRLGYFWHPDYKSMFVDQDLYWVCRNNMWMSYAKDLKFPHEHYSNGKCAKDETYERSDRNWDSGKEIYAKRKMKGFPIN